MILLSCKHPGKDSSPRSGSSTSCCALFWHTHGGNAPPYSEVLSRVSFMLPFFAQHQEQRSGWKAVVGYLLVSWPALSGKSLRPPQTGGNLHHLSAPTCPHSSRVSTRLIQLISPRFWQHCELKSNTL